MVCWGFLLITSLVPNRTLAVEGIFVGEMEFWTNPVAFHHGCPEAILAS